MSCKHPFSEGSLSVSLGIVSKIFLQNPSVTEEEEEEEGVLYGKFLTPSLMILVVVLVDTVIVFVSISAVTPSWMYCSA